MKEYQVLTIRLQRDAMSPPLMGHQALWVELHCEEICTQLCTSHYCWTFDLITAERKLKAMPKRDDVGI